ncbi:tyrosine-type recombinase/integrase [Pseudomonas fluorescens]|uniref:tyrosine-type recombinase/integrase n=1 Tax=Pseudomonas fluorescens TaxID=294 RepID=UPI002016DDE5|nr:site-specific integrase [Pseudomonas fluorescens]
MMKKETSHQLYSLIDELTLFSHMALGRTETNTFNNIPFMTWPDGSPCIPANLYILSLLERAGRGGNRGLSTRGSKGGSLGEYASKIGQLIRYCYYKNIDLMHLTDSTFTTFIGSLRDEKSPIYPTSKKKSEPTILAIGRICLTFLEFVGRLNGNPEFVAKGGTIRVTHETYTITSRNGRSVKRTYIHHHSLSLGGRTRSVFPITDANIKKLTDAVDTLPSSRFVKIRRKVMLLLLELTGARRGEISRIRVEDILNAFHSDEPMLRLETWKQGASSERMIPIHKMILKDVNTFIDMQRRKVAKKFKTGKNDGFLFIGETTGEGLSPDTITSEITALKTAAGIKERISPHMFRHAFITKKFVRMIKEHEMTNSDQFRRALLDVKGFIAEVMMWTGHKSPESVERYIHLAFKEITGYSATVTSVHLTSAMELFDRKQRQLVERLKTDLTVEEYEAELLELQRLRDEDFEIARKLTPAP